MPDDTTPPDALSTALEGPTKLDMRAPVLDRLTDPRAIPMGKGKALLIPGNPGNKGPAKGSGVGGKPAPWKALCKQWLEDPKLHKAIEKRLARGEHAMVKLVVESAEGAPEQRILHDTADGSALDRLFERLAPPPESTE